MEDSIIIPIEKYNKLINFKEEVEDNIRKSKKIVLSRDETDSLGHYHIYRDYYTKDEITSRFISHIENLENENKSLKILINNLIQMPFWKFIKWRRSYPKFKLYEK